MTIAPDNSDGIVALPLHICRVNVLGYLVHLQNLTSVDLIDACSASALDAQLIWINRLHHSLGLRTCCATIFATQVLFNENFGLNWVVASLKSLEAI